MSQRFFCLILCTILGTAAFSNTGGYAIENLQDSVNHLQINGASYSDIKQLISEYQFYLDTEPRKSLNSIKDAARLAEKKFSSLEELSDEQVMLWQSCEIMLAEAYYTKGKYLEAEEHLNKVLEIKESVLDSRMALDYSATRMKLDSTVESMKYSKTKKWLHDMDPLHKVGDKFDESNTAMKAAMEAKLFRTYAANGKVISADKHYQKAITFYQQTDKVEEIEGLESEYLAWKKDMDILLDKLDGSLEGIELAVVDETNEVHPSIRLQSLREEAIAMENSAELKGNSALLEQYKALQREIAKEEKKSALALLEKQNQLENQEREILLLEQDNELGQLTLDKERSKSEEVTRKKRNLSIGIALISALTMSLFFLYRHKTRSNEKLRIARDELEIAKERVASLLTEQVSGDIADALIKGGISAVQERFVTVMFLDIRGFTPKVAQLGPEEINKYQNDIFGFMIDIVESHHGNINQLLGDGFMATFGAPKSVGNDVQNAVDAGLKILDRLSIMNKEGVIPETRIGIGIDCGKAVMGNVGNDTRKQFSITGNVVISAARIEQANKAIGSEFLISEAVKQGSEINQELVEHEVLLKGRKSERILFQVI